MMDTMSLFFRFAYLVGYKPWDSGVPPPELKEVVEGPAALPPGRALDLGCGTGTSCVYLARHGWEVTGVELVGRAVAAARRKAAAAEVTPRILKGDVTKLDQLGIGDGYSLVLDLGCYHGIPESRRDAYAAGITAATRPKATFLLYAFAPGGGPRGVQGTDAEELERRFQGWELLSATPGQDRFAAFWYRLRRRSAQS